MAEEKNPSAPRCFCSPPSSLRLHGLLTELRRWEFNNWIPEGELIVEFLEYFFYCTSTSFSGTSQWMEIIQAFHSKNMICKKCSHPSQWAGEGGHRCDGNVAERVTAICFHAKTRSIPRRSSQYPVENASGKKTYTKQFQFPGVKSCIPSFFFYCKRMAELCACS